MSDSSVALLLVSAILLTGWTAGSPHLDANNLATRHRIKDAVDTAQALIDEVTRRGS
jgi:hypothetical protein